MAKKILFVVKGINADNLRLQPWRYVYEIAKHLAKGNTVWVLSDGDNSSEEDLAGLSLIRTKLLTKVNPKHLHNFINDMNVDAVFWSVSPRSLNYIKLFKCLNCQVNAIITSPIYYWNELFRAYKNGAELSELNTQIKQKLIPLRVFVEFLNSANIKTVIVQSNRNLQRLLELGLSGPKALVVRVGIDKVLAHAQASWLKNFSYHDDYIYLYMGAVKGIRGFDLLLNSFRKVVNQLQQKVHLRVLARGADEKQLSAIQAKIDAKNLTAQVSLLGGWLSNTELVHEIGVASAVVLPFALVPSDVPIAALEAMAHGKPVIVTDVDGLPELVGKHGVIAKVCKTDLANKMINIYDCKNDKEYCSQSILDYMSHYPDWHTIGGQVEKLVL